MLEPELGNEWEQRPVDVWRPPQVRRLGLRHAVGLSVFGKDPVELLAGVAHNLDGPLDLLLIAGVRNPTRGQGHPANRFLQLASR